VLSLPEIDEYAETLIAQRISMVDGVSQVQVYGAMKYAVRAQMDPNALANRGIGVDDVDAAIRNANPNTPTGTLYGKYSKRHGPDERQTGKRRPFSQPDRRV
jgi:HAE1 family hydrophobic/amphiphilic exporter-1